MSQHVNCRSAVHHFLIIFLMTITAGLLPTFALAQTEEEKTALQMFYSEDTLVTAPTRTPKPLSKVAENISIVTAEEIEAMNAHNVAEVLEMVTGVYVYYWLNDFGSYETSLIQSTDIANEDRNVLVLLDGVPWNFLAGGASITNTISVKTIKRLEIIKGPASSAWGSSLGGVINIVTKDAGDKAVPSGSVSASWGERNSTDYNAEVAGKAGIVGYYLHAGTQDSDGLKNNREYENDSLYAKLDIPLTSNIKLLLTAGYGDPRTTLFELKGDDYSDNTMTRASFETASLTAGLTDALSLEVFVHNLKQKFIMELDTLSAGDTFFQLIYDEETTGGGVKLYWKDNLHNAVAGWDISHGNLDQSSRATGTDDVKNNPGVSKWAFYANDTLSFGKLSVTPGIRYDKNNISGKFTSPSIGATYRLESNTILRASVARGFGMPPVSFTSTEDSGFEANPALKRESMWAYQAGAETKVSDYLTARAAVFHHEIKDPIRLGRNEADTKAQYHNIDGEVKRTGAELEIETVPVYNTSVKAGFSYHRDHLVPEDSFPDTDNAKNVYDYNLTFHYNDRKSFSAHLSGNYTWWSLPSADTAKYNTFIWDLNLIKKIYSAEKVNSSVFLTAHNIFNESNYEMRVYDNPRRWMEAGINLKF